MLAGIVLILSGALCLYPGISIYVKQERIAKAAIYKYVTGEVVGYDCHRYRKGFVLVVSYTPIIEYTINNVKYSIKDNFYTTMKKQKLHIGDKEKLRVDLNYPEDARRLNKLGVSNHKIGLVIFGLTGLVMLIAGIAIILFNYFN